ncbi:hypothetical protein E2C01_037731 [Portunus trituberculatus]|uniref:Uncharacterized protein n=1 Tax=Portunus trituberculatus TaxID=210409 RepID=A0A5B7F8W5_PORTR|nr:hypothetical protein [Portunus trituberculatus]
MPLVVLVAAAVLVVVRVVEVELVTRLYIEHGPNRLHVMVLLVELLVLHLFTLRGGEPGV